MHRLNEEAIEDIQRFEQGLRDAVRVATNKYSRYRVYFRAAACVIVVALLVLIVGVCVLRRWTAIEACAAVAATVGAAAALAVRDSPRDDAQTHTWRINQILRDFNVHYSLECNGLFQVAPFRSNSRPPQQESLYNPQQQDQLDQQQQQQQYYNQGSQEVQQQTASGSQDAEYPSTRTPLCPGRYTECEVEEGECDE